jgi:hypothetical protein
MRGKSGLALGLAIGYLFGTKAGRERYEQLSQSARRLAENPSLQRLQTEVSGLFNASKQRATATIEGTATRVADKVEETSKSTATEESKSGSSGSAPVNNTGTGARSGGTGSSGSSRGSRSSSSGSRSSSRSSDA